MSEALFNGIVWGWIALALITFIALQFIVAPFGRHTSKKYGPMMDNRLAWILMELPSPVLLSYCFFTGTNEPQLVTYIFWGLWMMHYSNRTFIYPLRQRDIKKKMPIMVMGSAIGFNLINGFLNGYFLGNYSDQYTTAWLQTPQFIIGVTFFLVGMVINIQSDDILLNLRKPGESGYKIPEGGLFSKVSCPNLLGEMIEWMGFALMVWGLPALSFAIWTIANLLPRAIAHHRWYLDKFEDYPKERKAVLPFLW